MLFSPAPRTYNHCKNHEFSCRVSSFPQIPSSRIRKHLSFRPMVPTPCAWGMISLVYTAVFKDAKAADAVQGKCPILSGSEPDKFLGMYQVGETPVDIQIFNNSHCPIDRFLIAELERGGNLKAQARAHARVGSSCLERRTQVDTRGHFSASMVMISPVTFAVGTMIWVLREKAAELPFDELMSADHGHHA